ncbi:MAG: hypothetical protein WA919_09305 [Coleofasciculaceae cyanobacterium]
MDSIQQQIIALSHKVDALYQVVEPLSRQVSDSLSTAGNMSSSESGNLSSSIRQSDYQSQGLMRSVMEHKDVLSDGNGSLITSYQNGDNALSAEIQIQRLTAQLTAAYNRIAALEEQLLARRIHS